MNNSEVSTKTAKNCRHNLISRAVRAVENDLHSVKLYIRCRKNIFHVMLYEVVSELYCTDISAAWAVKVVMHFNVANDAFNLILYRVRQLVAVSAEEFDTVVIIRIM